jgi:hypothetical protein
VRALARGDALPMDSVGLDRVVASGALLGAVCSVASVALADTPTRAAAPDAPMHIEVWADRDDDDADGRPDGEEDLLTAPTYVDLVPIERRLFGAVLEIVSGADHARVVAATGRPLSWGLAAPESGWWQGVSPGRVELVARGRGVQTHVTIDVRGIDMRDGGGHAVDMARSHASLERTPPMRAEGGADASYDDFDALRVVAVLAGDAAGLDGDRELAVESVTSVGVRLDVIPRLALSRSSCARPYEGMRCWSSAPLRLVTDDEDRNHPLVADRSIKAEVGGAIVVRSAKHKVQMMRVLGPRSSPAGPIGRLRATLRPFVVRIAPGGAPSIGGTEAGAANALRTELAAAAAIWGQCGLTFGDTRSLEIKLVDPPPSHLISVGDDLSTPASGGEIRIVADGHAIAVTMSHGDSSDVVARKLARAVERAGLVAVVSVNARIGPGVSPSVDVSVRRRDGTLVAVDTPPGVPVSSDATMSVRIGAVDLLDGLRHFTDVDAMSGTLEERTLLKAIDDGDPTTIEVVVVPLFSGSGRIGESFIGSDGSSVRNAVVLDRAGIRARKSSLALAHELGHVLMDMPGHPDDYGVDTPTLLMDSDASDASPFGPRRITLEECARVVRQAGPRARLPLLAAWPIGVIGF